MLNVKNKGKTWSCVGASFLTPPLCRSSQKLFGVALLNRYRSALETAVQISSCYNVPPLPGRTIILISDDMYGQRMKYDFCLPPDPEQEDNEEQEEQNRKKKEEDRFNPSVRPLLTVCCWYLLSGTLVSTFRFSASHLRWGRCQRCSPWWSGEVLRTFSSTWLLGEALRKWSWNQMFFWTMSEV